LTKDEMTVRKIYSGGQMFKVSGAGYAPEGVFSVNGGTPVTPTDALKQMLTAATLASDTQIFNGENDSGSYWDIKGDPTEGALVVAAAKAGLQKEALETESPRVHEIPFTSETKRMTTLHKTADGVMAYAKGAPEMILDGCDFVLTENGVTDLDALGREQILNHAQEMASDALRVLAISSKSNATRETAESGMTFLGLAGMIDPPRMEAKEAIAICAEAGIRPVMITGDHPVTAQAVARELGLLRDGGRVMTGAELVELTVEQFATQRTDTETKVSTRPL
jgi:Ca2+-transporting ATPase